MRFLVIPKGKQQNRKYKREKEIYQQKEEKKT
jgi:hypothetical protein